MYIIILIITQTLFKCVFYHLSSQALWMSGSSEFLKGVITHAHFSFLEQMWMSWQLLSKKSYFDNS